MRILQLSAGRPTLLPFLILLGCLFAQLELGSGEDTTYSATGGVKVFL